MDICALCIYACNCRMYYYKFSALSGYVTSSINTYVYKRNKKKEEM